MPRADCVDSLPLLGLQAHCDHENTLTGAIAFHSGCTVLLVAPFPRSTSTTAQGTFDPKTSNRVRTEPEEATLGNKGLVAVPLMDASWDHNLEDNPNPVHMMRRSFAMDCRAHDGTLLVSDLRGSTSPMLIDYASAQFLPGDAHFTTAQASTSQSL